MTVSVASFREHYPEFAEGKRFPNAVIDNLLALALNFVNASRWGKVTDTGVELFAAHYLVLQRKAMDAADAGNTPGEASGIVSAESVDKVSVSYDVQAGTEKDAGHWNQTTYGQRFFQLSRMMGAGPIQIGVGTGVIDPLSAINAWPGPTL